MSNVIELFPGCLSQETNREILGSMAGGIPPSEEELLRSHIAYLLIEYRDQLNLRAEQASISGMPKHKFHDYKCCMATEFADRILDFLEGYYDSA